MTKRRRNFLNRRLNFEIVSLITLFMTGCSGGTNSTTTSPSTPQSVAVEATTTTEEAKPTSVPQEVSNPHAEKLGLAKTAVESGRIDEARQILDELRVLEGLSESERNQIDELDSVIVRNADDQTQQERDVELSRVPQLIADGQLDAATASLDAAAARKPNVDQIRSIQSHRQHIDRVRVAQRKLGTWMKLLGSKTRSEARAAQGEILQEPEAAIPLLLAAL
ncbi:MAG: hypothetical protein FJ267_19415, partial [Planctomycetes bacterium]|nr:hypothetical protein [Planctomycetota bacterium]